MRSLIATMGIDLSARVRLCDEFSEKFVSSFVWGKVLSICESSPLTVKVLLEKLIGRELVFGCHWQRASRVGVKSVIKCIITAIVV